jgi:sialic acid synthase SpsE
VHSVRIGSHLVGDGPCLVIGEAGSNHDGQLDQALRLVELGAEAGVDGVKFQVFRADRLYPRSAGVSEYLELDRPIHDVIAELEVPYEWLPALARRCRELGLLFVASAFDEESADRLDPFVDAFKIASYELTHLPLVDYVARKGKPTIVSTGTADLEEVAATVDCVRSTGNNGLVLMQCTAAYPAPIDSLNLRAIPLMRDRFGVPVGLSDHSSDPLVGPLTSVALGAAALEKHYTLSRDLPGPDHRFALEPDELKLMVRRVREAESALGSGEKTVQPVEEELRRFARRSVFAVRDIAVGEELTKENVAALRTGTLEPGLDPIALDELLGRRATRAIGAETAIRREDYA